MRERLGKLDGREDYEDGPLREEDRQHGGDDEWAVAEARRPKAEARS
jgi:hypothetical protein